MNLETMIFHLKETKIHKLESQKDSLELEIEGGNFTAERKQEIEQQLNDLEQKILNPKHVVDADKVYTLLGKLVDKSYRKHGGFYKIMATLGSLDANNLELVELAQMTEELGLAHDEVISEIKNDMSLIK